MAQLLLNKGYAVSGTSRDVEGSSWKNLEALGIRKDVKLITADLVEITTLVNALRTSGAEEVYLLSGQSSVALSFEQPAESIQSTILGALNVLEAIKWVDPSIRLFYPSSSECFGDTGSELISERTRFSPRSPYAVGKASAAMLLNNYREAYNIFVCTGYLFNHESPLRPTRFVTQKIVRGAYEIAMGRADKLELGRLDVSRDWGWAPEYVEAMWLMLQQSEPTDYIIATGKTYSLEDFVDRSFSHFGLQWRDHVVQNEAWMRPSDILINRADTSKAKELLGWEAKKAMPEVVAGLISALEE